MIKVEHLFFEIEHKELLKNISLTIKNKNIVGIIGSNGSGKSTLLKNIYRFLKCNSGEVYIKNKNLRSYKNKDLAREIAVLTQRQGLNFDFSVEEIMDMGSYARKKKCSDKEKREEIKNALSLVGMENFIERDFLSLSGGEMQRVLISRAIFQDSDILILDEPTNHLDIKHQIEIMDLLKSLDKTILMVLHDINLASYYCDYIYAMKEGRILHEGPPHYILQENVIEDIYDIKCNIVEHPSRKKSMAIF